MSGASNNDYPQNLPFQRVGNQKQVWTKVLRETKGRLQNNHILCTDSFQDNCMKEFLKIFLLSSFALQIQSHQSWVWSLLLRIYSRAWCLDGQFLLSAYVWYLPVFVWRKLKRFSLETPHAWLLGWRDHLVHNTLRFHKCLSIYSSLLSTSQHQVFWWP